MVVNELINVLPKSIPVGSATLFLQPYTAAQRIYQYGYSSTTRTTGRDCLEPLSIAVQPQPTRKTTIPI